MKALLSLHPLFAGQWRWIVTTLVLTLITALAGLALFGISGWFLTAAALSGAGVAFNLFAPSAAVRGFSFIRILSRYGEKMTGHDGTLKLLSRLRGWLFGVLFPLVPVADRDRRHGDLVSRLTADVDALDTVFLVAIGPFFTALLIGMGVTTGLVFIAPAAALPYAMCFTIAALALPLVMVLTTRKAGERAAQEAADLRVATLEAIEGQIDLISFGATGAAQAEFDRKARRLAMTRRRPAVVATLSAAGVQASTAAATIVVLAVCLPALQGGELSAPLLVGVLLAVIASFETTALQVRGVAKLAAAAAAARRIQHLANQEPAVRDVGGKTALPASGDIVFDGVSFGYDPARPVLRDLSLTVRQGTHIAIQGASGSGKSTLLALLLRLAEPQEGGLRFGGVDIAEAGQEELHRRIALQTQDAPVFHDTIRNNLLVANPTASEAEMWTALKASQLAELVETLPRRLDAVVGETGKTLSVGQARRLCLARTLLSRAPVLAFDEPTSGLDRENELAFLAALRKAAHGRTLIVITHANLPAGLMDEVYTFSDGRLSATPKVRRAQA